MKLGISIATAVALLANDATVSAFTPQSTPRVIKFSHAGLKSRMHVSMTAEAETEALELMDYASVNALTYRQLQQQCKQRSLAANGNTAALRCRLLDNLGLLQAVEECVVGDEEVRLCTLSLFVCQTTCICSSSFANKAFSNPHSFFFLIFRNVYQIIFSLRTKVTLILISMLSLKKLKKSLPWVTGKQLLANSRNSTKSSPLQKNLYLLKPTLLYSMHAFPTDCRVLVLQNLPVRSWNKWQRQDIQSLHLLVMRV